MLDLVPRNCPAMQPHLVGEGNEGAVHLDSDVCRPRECVTDLPDIGQHNPLVFLVDLRGFTLFSILVIDISKLTGFVA